MQSFALVSSPKIDKDAEKTLALFGNLYNAEINDLTFQNASVTINANEGVSVSAALLALDARNVTMKNCHIDGLTIDSGRGDAGTSGYTLGDLFVNEETVFLRTARESGSLQTAPIPHGSG